MKRKNPTFHVFLGEKLTGILTGDWINVEFEINKKKDLIAKIITQNKSPRIKSRTLRVNFHMQVKWFIPPPFLKQSLQIYIYIYFPWTAKAYCNQFSILYTNGYSALLKLAACYSFFKSRFLFFFIRLLQNAGEGILQISSTSQHLHKLSLGGHEAFNGPR